MLCLLFTVHTICEGIKYCVFLQIWSSYEEPKEVEVVEEPVERKVNYSKVIVTEVTDQFTFFAQKVDNGECKFPE